MFLTIFGFRNLSLTTKYCKTATLWKTKIGDLENNQFNEVFTVKNAYKLFKFFKIFYIKVGSHSYLRIAADVK